MMRTQHVITTLVGIMLSLLLAAASAAVKPVVDAAERGDTGLVRELLQNGADANEAQGDGMTALHWAAESGDTELAGLLIYAGANLEAGTRIGGYTPLHIASRKGHAEIVKTLLDANARAGAITTTSRVMPLHLAAAAGNTDAVRALLNAGADANALEGAWGQTPLIFAAAANRAEVINLLLGAGADPSITANAKDVVELEKADKIAEQRMAEFLADFKKKEGGGTNWQPQPSQVQAAIEASREIQRKWPDVPDPSCDTYEDADLGNEGTTSCTNPVTYNADGEPVYDYAGGAADENGEPKPPSYGELVGSWGGLAPLHHAVRQGYSAAALTLLEGGAGINQPTAGDQTTPLLLAAINGQFDIALLLLEKGADPKLASAAGTTPLFAVLESSWAPRASYAHPIEHQQQNATHLQVLEALMRAGADPNVRLNTQLWYMEYTFPVLGQAGIHYKGATPFWRAVQALDVNAMRILKNHGADPGVPTIKLAKRKRPPMHDPDEEDIVAGNSKVATLADSQTELGKAQFEEEQEEEDHSGLPPIPVGGPYIYPIHAAAGAGYGQNFAGNAHVHVPGNWLAAVRFLVEECDADVNKRDANGYTALHHAASRGDNDVIEYLVSNGADVMVVSRKGETTADMANGPIQRVSPFPDTIALLVSLGAVNNNNCVSC